MARRKHQKPRVPDLAKRTETKRFLQDVVVPAFPAGSVTFTTVRRAMYRSSRRRREEAGTAAAATGAAAAARRTARAGRRGTDAAATARAAPASITPLHQVFSAPPMGAPASFDAVDVSELDRMAWPV